MRILVRGGLVAVACCIIVAAFTPADAGAAGHDPKANPSGARARALTVDPAEAVQAFWRYSRCVVIKEPKKVEMFLDYLPWRSDSEIDRIGRTAFIIPNCLNQGFVENEESLSFDLGNLQGTLAEASLVNRYGTEWPDYSRVERIFTADLIERAATMLYKANFLLLSFAECVFRNDNAHSRQLFQTMPFSNKETAAFASLDPMLSACAPNDPGQQLKFSRLQLRGLLAEAAYEVDRMYRAGIKPDR